MLCGRDKRHGQEILGKLRKEGSVWVTATNPRSNVPSRRVRVVLVKSDEYVERPFEYMVLWRQRLYLMRCCRDGEGRLFESDYLGGSHPVKDKYIFGRVAEEHPKEKL